MAMVVNGFGRAMVKGCFMGCGIAVNSVPRVV